RQHLSSGDASQPRSSSVLRQGRRGMTAAAQSDAAGFPVRAGERPWTDTEISQVRRQLADEADELRAEIGKGESSIADRLGDSVSDAGDDQADVGAKTYEREHELSLTYNARDLLAQSERALARIEAGTYGSCESCGQPIGKARLKAFPRATLCVSCQQREGRRWTAKRSRPGGAARWEPREDPNRPRPPHT